MFLPYPHFKVIESLFLFLCFTAVSHYLLIEIFKRRNNTLNLLARSDFSLQHDRAITAGKQHTMKVQSYIEGKWHNNGKETNLISAVTGEPVAQLVEADLD